MIELVRMEPGRYHDSVTLMRASAAGAGLDGVDAVIAAVGTELNVGLLIDAGFAVDDVTPYDSVIAVRADSGAAANPVDAVLTERPRTSAGEGSNGPPPHTGHIVAAAGLADAGALPLAVAGCCGAGFDRPTGSVERPVGELGAATDSCEVLGGGGGGRVGG